MIPKHQKKRLRLVKAFIFKGQQLTSSPQELQTSLVVFLIQSLVGVDEGKIELARLPLGDQLVHGLQSTAKLELDLKKKKQIRTRNDLEKSPSW